MRNKQSLKEWDLNKPLDFNVENKVTKKKKGKKNINAIVYEVDGIVFDSKTEYEFYEYLTTNKEELSIDTIELQPSYIVMDAYDVACWKCNGTGLIYNEKTKRHNKCRRAICDNGTLHKKEIIYTPDYLIKYKDGRELVVDIKGYLGQSNDFNLRKRLFEARYGVEIVIVTKVRNQYGAKAWKWH